jgi:hypothetical protein
MFSDDLVSEAVALLTVTAQKIDKALLKGERAVFMHEDTAFFVEH